MMKRWRAPAASCARYGCDAPARLARGEIASTRADRSRVTKTIAGINRRRHQDQHYNECTENKQAGFHLPSPSFPCLQPQLDQAAEGLGSRNVVSDCPGIKRRYGCWFATSFAYFTESDRAYAPVVLSAPRRAHCHRRWAAGWCLHPLETL